MTALLLAEPEPAVRGFLERQLRNADPAARVRALARADDCLARPFVYEELLARIHAVLRRCPPRVELTEVGSLAIDRAARRVTVAGREVELSAKEYSLLVKLASDPDRVFTREQLLRDVWGFRTYVPTRTLESHASRVRRKLAAAGLPGWVVNVWGVGGGVSGDVGRWREVASFHGFGLLDRLAIR